MKHQIVQFLKMTGFRTSDQTCHFSPGGC